MLDGIDEAGQEKPKGAAMSDEELVTLLDEMNRRSVGYLSDEVSVDQDDNLDRYLGRPYGDEEEGHSQAISMDVAEVVDWAMPDLLEPFVSGDKAVEFEPSTRADEQYCSQANDFVDHVFWRDNPGFLILHDTIKSGCIQKIGVIKTTWKAEDKEAEEHLTGLSLMQLQELQQDQSIRIDEVVPEQAQDPVTFPDGLVYTVKLTRTIKSGCVKVMALPPEEFKVSQRAPALDQDIEYVAHESEKTRGSILSMGFDADVVAGLSSDRRRDADRSDTRFYNEDRREDQSRKKASDILTLIEEYPLIDMDESGTLKRWQVFRVGKTILDKQPVDCHPFDGWCADRIPHRLIGLALADKVKQTQRIKTHLTRQMLDNVYLANQPRTELPEGAERDNGETIEDLLNIRIGGIVRTKQPGMLVPIQTPDRSKTALDAILYMDNVREQQSGITRNGAAMDSEAIDPKSATQVRKEDRNEQSRKRLMARMIAETLLAPLFMKILKLLVKYQDQPREIKLRDNWVAMDPRSWNADLKAQPSVGLGYANRDEELQAAQIVGTFQEKLMLGGTGMVRPEHIWETMKKLVTGVGWKFPEKYCLDPTSPQGQQVLAQASQEKPDPKMEEAKAKAELAKAQAQHQGQLKEVELQARMREAEQKAVVDTQIAAMKAESERRNSQMKIEMEAQVAALRMAMEERLAIREQDMEAELARRQLRMKTNADANINGGVRFGGDIG